MKHLRSYNESNFPLMDNEKKVEASIKDFCETNLAYLIDEGYDELTEESVKDFCEESLIYLIDNGMKIIVDKYYAVKGDKRFSICLSSDNGVIKWVEVKDYIIPFLIRLNEKFTMIDCFPGTYGENCTVEIDMYPNGHSEGGTNSDYFTYEDIVDEKVNDRLRNNIKYISFFIRKKGHLRRYNESKVDLDQLQDFCEDNLIYLLDGDFKMKVYEPISGRGKLGKNYLVTLCKLGPSEGIYGDDIAINFSWGEIKDYFIPFLTRLNKNFNIEELTLYDGILSNGRGELDINLVLSKGLSDDKEILQIVIEVAKEI